MTVIHYQWHSAKPRPGPVGFTLIEVMVTLVVMAILLAISAPSMDNALLGSKLGSYANKLISSAIVARSESIKRNTPATLCASSDGTTCAGTGDWEQGWVVLSGTTVIERQQPVPSGFKITALDSSNAATRTLVFQPTGVGSTQAIFTICRASPSPGSQERLVTVSATGRASASKTATGLCS